MDFNQIMKLDENDDYFHDTDSEYRDDLEKLDIPELEELLNKFKDFEDSSCLDEIVDYIADKFYYVRLKEKLEAFLACLSEEEFFVLKTVFCEKLGNAFDGLRTQCDFTELFDKQKTVKCQNYEVVERILAGDPIALDLVQDFMFGRI